MTGSGVRVLSRRPLSQYCPEKMAMVKKVRGRSGPEHLATRARPPSVQLWGPFDHVPTKKASVQASGEGTNRWYVFCAHNVCIATELRREREGEPETVLGQFRSHFLLPPKSSDTYNVIPVQRNEVF
eukprot:EG_transcript_33084